MSRVRVQSYGNGMSKSAKVLAEYLEVKRIKVTGSRFRPTNGDVVVNWGIPRQQLANVRYLNPLDAVKRASNKLLALQHLHGAGVPVPDFCSNAIDIRNGNTYYARKTLNGHSGEGIEVFTATAGELYPSAPLYVKALEKKREYRVIVVNGQAVDTKSKRKKRDFEGERDGHVWNCSNGYIFARHVGTYPDRLNEIAIDATHSLGLCYGAVDIVLDTENNLYVLEINTAFGLEGQTIQLVGDAIKGVLDEGV